MDINSWVNRVIKGIGGFESWEDHESVIFHNSREEGIAEFVIRCLANPSCKGSDKVLEEIIKQREKLSQTPENWPSDSHSANLEEKLVIGAQIKIGQKYVDEVGGFDVGEIITLIDGYFESDNGLYTETQTAPSVWREDSKEFESIFHLFGNNFEYWYDCKIVTGSHSG